MASTKEAIGIIIDVSHSMSQAPPGEETALQTSLTAVNMILQRKLFSESKDEVVLVLSGTPTTANDLADGSGTYEHITVARPLGPVDWDLLNYIQEEIQPSNSSADFLDAMVVGMDHLMKGIQGKRGFVSKRIILFSDVASEFGDDQLKDIIASMKEFEVDLNVIGPDLNDDEEDDDKTDGPGSGATNSHGKAKSAQQRAGETLLRHILELVNGESYSFSEALPALSFFQSRSVRPTPWKCPLEIGDSLSIPINGYIKVKEAKAKSYKNVYAKDPDCGIQRVRTCHLNDEAETEIDQSETVEGHRYGSTLVPFSADDKEAMKFRAQKCFKVLGFTKSENVKRSHLMGDSCMMVSAEKGDEAAAVALSALIRALYETNMNAIVRRCYSAATSPRLGVLTAHIKANYECLIYHELPFSEDVRQFTFGSLPLKGDATPANKKFVPTEEQLEQMDQLIDAMDLTKPSEDDDEDTEELLKPKLTFNPYLQRLYQCLQHRAMQPDDPLPELSPVVANYLKPPAEVTIRSEAAVENLKKLFKLTNVSKKKAEQTGDSLFKDTDGAGEPAAKKPKMDDNLDGGLADIVKARVTEIGTVRPVQDFLDMTSQKDEDRFDAACEMMEKRIEQIVTDSFGSQLYSKAVECLKTLREQTIKKGDPGIFNDFLVKFKDSLMSKGRKDFWQQIVEGKLSLISKLESEHSDVTKEEADTFTLGGASRMEESADDEPEEDADDLLDQL